VALGDYSRVFGSATACLNINSVQTNDAGNYTVVVTNSYGSVTSVVAVVTIGPANPASGPNWNWVRPIGGNGSDSTSGLAADGSGNVYVAGEIWGRIRFGQIELDSHFDHDTFLAKYNANGELQWARQLNAFSVTIARNLAIDANGDVIMSGYFDQTCDFDNLMVVAHGAQDVFLAKFNPSGNVIWAESLGGPGMESPRSLTVDAARNIYLAGSFEQTADLGGVTLTTSGQRDVFIVACDPLRPGFLGETSRRHPKR
jgi:hypothetical protein